MAEAALETSAVTYAQLAAAAVVCGKLPYQPKGIASLRGGVGSHRMEGFPRVESLRLEIRRARVDLLRTRLQLGATLLDIATLEHRRSPPTQVRNGCSYCPGPGVQILGPDVG